MDNLIRVVDDVIARYGGLTVANRTSGIKLATLMEARQRTLEDIAALEAYVMAMNELEAPDAGERARMHALGVAAGRRLTAAELRQCATALEYQWKALK